MYKQDKHYKEIELLSRMGYDDGSGDDSLHCIYAEVLQYYCKYLEKYIGTYHPNDTAMISCFYISMDYCCIRVGYKRADGSMSYRSII